MNIWPSEYNEECWWGIRAGGVSWAKSGVWDPAGVFLLASHSLAQSNKKLSQNIPFGRNVVGAGRYRCQNVQCWNIEREKKPHTCSMDINCCVYWTSFLGLLFFFLHSGERSELLQASITLSTDANVFSVSNTKHHFSWSGQVFGTRSWVELPRPPLLLSLSVDLVLMFL